MSDQGWSRRAWSGVALGAWIAFAAADGRAQDVIQQWEGTANYASLGQSVALLGDVDGDGVADVALGQPSPQYPDYKGHVFVRSGRTGALLLDVAGESNYDYFGSVVAAVGDWNLDGRADFAAASGTGYASVFSGANGAVLKRFTGASGSFGRALAGVGDANHDGWPDLVVGSPYENGGRGKAFFYSGRTGANLFTVAGENPNDQFGASVAGAGDCNGDGFREIVIGAPSWPNGTGHGRIYVYAGPNGTPLFTSDGSNYENFGYSVDGAGDVDADGKDDVLVGAPNNGSYNQSGRAVVLSGSNGATIRDWTGSYYYGRLGASVSAVGDVNADGFDDVAVGAPNDSSTGRVYVYSGKDGSLHQTIASAYNGGGWGSALDGGFDVDGDGVMDLIVGSPSSWISSYYAGHATLYSVAFSPFVTAIAPARGRYTGGAAVTVTGRNFSYGTGTEVAFGSRLATNVVVVNDTTITCTAPANSPGLFADVAVRDSIGQRSLAAAFACTPAMLAPWGDFTPGGYVVNTYLCDPGDTLWGILGTDPAQIPVPPFAGYLGINPYTDYFIEPKWMLDTYVLDDNIPADPSLSGLTVLFQALIGPKLAGKNRNGATTNVVSITIE